VNVRQRAGRVRPRPLDWVVGAARPRGRRRAAVSSTAPPTGPTFCEWLSPYWSPGLRVLEICEREPSLLRDALRSRAADYVCLSPPGRSCWSAEVGRLGWTLLEGEPAALVRQKSRFDLVAWMRQDENVVTLFETANLLLTPDGILVARTDKRLDARLTSFWSIGEVMALADGGLGVLARRRRLARAA